MKLDSIYKMLLKNHIIIISQSLAHSRFSINVSFSTFLSILSPPPSNPTQSFFLFLHFLSPFHLFTSMLFSFLSSPLTGLKTINCQHQKDLKRCPHFKINDMPQVTATHQQSHRKHSALLTPTVSHPGLSLSQLKILKVTASWQFQ